MINIFFSHSSVYKDLVEKVASEVGREFSIVDKYTFENGESLKQEIDLAIDRCKIFCLFVSVEILSSEWVKYELARVRNLKDSNNIKFCAFNIDPKIEIKDIKGDPSILWILSYLIDYESKPLKIARLLRRKMRELIWNEYAQISACDSIFIGREKELQVFDKMLYEHLNVSRNTYIVSGMPNVGRKRLIKQIIRTKLACNVHSSYEPLLISLGENDSLFEFIQQLNEAVQVYENEQLYSEIVNGTLEKDIALQLIDVIIKNNDVLIIDDNRSIVNSNGDICDWFADLVTDNRMPENLTLFISSITTSPYWVTKKYPMILFQQITELDKSSMKYIFNAYAKIKDVKCSEEDTQLFLDAFTGFPAQAYLVIDEICHSGLHRAKLDLKLLMRIFDKDLGVIYERLIKNDDNTRNILVLLSKFEFISYDFLCQIVPPSVLDISLDKLERASVFEIFGASKQYMRLNTYLSDFINRNHIGLDRNHVLSLQKQTTEILKNTADDVLDLSEQLYRIKEMIRTSSGQIDPKYMIPSYVLKVVVDEYKSGHNKNVIAIANKVLYDYKRNNYESVEYAIRYWKCLAMCKENDVGVFEEAKRFKSGYTYNFLIGFYYRFLADYKKAESYLC